MRYTLRKPIPILIGYEWLPRHHCEVLKIQTQIKLGVSLEDTRATQEAAWYVPARHVQLGLLVKWVVAQVDRLGLQSSKAHSKQQRSLQHDSTQMQ
jgi:hypothetical protein